MNKNDSTASNQGKQQSEVDRPSGADALNDPENSENVEPADEILVSRSQAGDMQAFDQLVTRYRGRIYAMTMNMIHNEADAWDLAQDTFVKAWKALPKFQARSNFYTWLYRISHNVTYDWLRKKQNRVIKAEFDDNIQSSQIDRSAPTAPRDMARPDQHAQGNELKQSIRDALALLSPEHRSVILLKEVDGLRYEEIAERNHCSIGTVMSRLFYARKKLQAIFTEQNIRPS
ncbi:MAG: sigma-70 family RNA polymerase sigma factor [Verrucomicrobiales bacterium]|nr:sigma-70 family RNA polymerase sigma factor [Verrucomicrobiales bacterium]